MEYQIKNFKAFGAPVSIPIRPITLLFGPNSSGKSSIIQSLLLLQQSFGNKKEGALIPTGGLVDLGSYKEFVYQHDTRNEFSIAFKDYFKTPEEAFKEPEIIDGFMGHYDEDGNPIDDVMEGQPAWENEIFQELSDEIIEKKISNEIFFKFEDNTQRIITKKQIIKVDAHSFTLNLNSENKIVKDNYGALYELSGNYKSIFAKHYEDSILLKNYGEYRFFELSGAREKFEALQEITSLQCLLSILSSCMKELVFDKSIFEGLKEFFLVWENLSEGQKEKAYEKIKEELAPYRNGRYIAEMLCLPIYMSTGILGCEILQGVYRLPELYCFPYANLLNPGKLFGEFVYIPPLRHEPKRFFFLNDETPGAEIYYDLLRKKDTLLSLINAELSKLAIDYEVGLSDIADMKSGIPIGFSLNLKNLSSGVESSFRDVGFGISQILPIVFNSVINKKTTLLIEQPELHLHPALQAEQGDLFIRSALGEQKNTFIIETHSEHLILRLLRRIRETTEGTLPDNVPPIKPNDVAVVYIQPGKNGSEAIHLPITPDGDFVNDWPNGFFTEREKELF